MPSNLTKKIRKYLYDLYGDIDSEVLLTADLNKRNGLLILLQAGYLNISLNNLKDFQKFIDGSLQAGVEEDPRGIKFKDILDNMKEDQYLEILNEVPILNDFVKFFEEYVVCNIRVGITLPGTSILINFESEGFQEIFDYLK